MGIINTRGVEWCFACRVERQGWYITTAFMLESLTKEDWSKTCCQLMRDKALVDLPWFEGEQ